MFQSFNGVSFWTIYWKISSWNVLFSQFQVHFKRLGLHDAICVNWTWTMSMSKLLFCLHFLSISSFARFTHTFLWFNKIEKINRWHLFPMWKCVFGSMKHTILIILNMTMEMEDRSVCKQIEITLWSHCESVSVFNLSSAYWNEHLIWTFAATYIINNTNCV